MNVSKIKQIYCYFTENTSIDFRKVITNITRKGYKKKKKTIVKLYFRYGRETSFG